MIWFSAIIIKIKLQTRVYIMTNKYINTWCNIVIVMKIIRYKSYDFLNIILKTLLTDF